MTDELIRGKVARILSTREVVINKGRADGVKNGMIFAILSSEGEDIVDPDTQEILGSIERTKVLVKVVEVDDRLSVAKTFRYRFTGGTFTAQLTGVASLFEPRRKVYDSLEIDENTATEIDEKDSYVKVGDPVKQSAYEE
jgi:hypothetical protein